LIANLVTADELTGIKDEKIISIIQKLINGDLHETKTNFTKTSTYLVNEY
jgi:hypothetical protein